MGTEEEFQEMEGSVERGSDLRTATSLDDLPLDLNREEKRRMAALIMAIKYYTDTIVKDGQLYTAMVSTGKQLQPATVLAVIDVAEQFEDFLLGQRHGRVEGGNEFEERAVAGDTPPA